MHFNRNLVSLRVSNGVADRFLRNPVFDVCGLGLEMIRSLENDHFVFLRHN